MTEAFYLIGSRDVTERVRLKTIAFKVGHFTFVESAPLL